MRAQILLDLLTDAIILGIFGAVLARAARLPTRANLDAALLFGTLAALAVGREIVVILHLPVDPYLMLVGSALLLALPYLFLRLVDDFCDVPPLLLRAAKVLLVLIVVLTAMTVRPVMPPWLTIVALGYFVGFQTIVAVAFVKGAREAFGVTRRRMLAIALGAILLSLAIATTGLVLAFPSAAGFWDAVQRILGLAAVTALFVGFATPRVLRRMWQEPELHAFLEQVATLPGLPSDEEMIGELAKGAAQTLGAPHAVIACWDESAQVLRVRLDTDETLSIPPGQGIIGQVFTTQRARFVPDLRWANLGIPDVATRYGAKTALVAPISAGPRHLGVLIILAKREPIFAEDDLELAQILADQAAVVIENHALIGELARLRAREEVARLKEEFISAAAHELKTPLTVLSGQAQLLIRRARQNPQAPVDIRSLERIVEAARRLDSLVQRLLDVARRAPSATLPPGPPEMVNLVETAQKTCQRLITERHQCIVNETGPVVIQADRRPIERLIENLIENAVTYSPAGGPIRVNIWQSDGEAHLTVTDQGIGIPAADLPHIFERFYRASNVNPRQFPGMGLSLYTSREIVTGYGGKIWVTSPGPGKGTTVHVVLPTTVPSSRASPPAVPQPEAAAG